MHPAPRSNCRDNANRQFSLGNTQTLSPQQFAGRQNTSYADLVQLQAVTCIKVTCVFTAIHTSILEALFVFIHWFQGERCLMVSNRCASATSDKQKRCSGIERSVCCCTTKQQAFLERGKNGRTGHDGPETLHARQTPCHFLDLPKSTIQVLTPHSRTGANGAV